MIIDGATVTAAVLFGVQWSEECVRLGTELIEVHDEMNSRDNRWRYRHSCSPVWRTAEQGMCATWNRIYEVHNERLVVKADVTVLADLNKEN